MTFQILRIFFFRKSQKIKKNLFSKKAFSFSRFSPNSEIQSQILFLSIFYINTEIVWHAAMVAYWSSTRIVLCQKRFPKQCRLNQVIQIVRLVRPNHVFARRYSWYSNTSGIFSWRSIIDHWLYSISGVLHLCHFNLQGML